MARVLIIDDEKSIRITMQFFLQDAGHHVRTAESAEEANEYLENETFDVVVTDIILPNQTGTELFEHIHKNYLNLKVILITGEPTLKTATTAIRLGAFDYLSKPVTENQICSAVEKAAETKNLEDENRRLEEENKKHREHLQKLVEERTEELRWSEERFSLALDAANDGLWDWNLKSNATYFSPRYFTMLGYKPDEFPSDYQNWESRLHPDDKTKVVQTIMKHLESGESFEIEFRMKHKNGGYKWIMGKGKAVEWDEKGKPIRMVGTHVDISARKDAEKKTKASEKRFLQLFEKMLDGFALHEIICNEDGEPVDYRFLTVNPAFETMTGLKAENLIGKTVREVMPGTESHWIKTYGKVALTGNPVYFENYSQELDSYFKVTAYRPASMQFACIFQNITERKKAEKALEENQAKLQMQYEMLDQKNAALRELMDQVKFEKEKIEQQIQINVDQLLLPLLAKLDNKGSKLDQSVIQMLAQSFRDLTSCFGKSIMDKTHALSPREIEVCNLIKGGLSSKEIADLLGISYRSVTTHRNNIRKKLGISSKDVNLATYLNTL